MALKNPDLPGLHFYVYLGICIYSTHNESVTVAFILDNFNCSS